jgi:hypothetical protein
MDSDVQAGTYNLPWCGTTKSGGTVAAAAYLLHIEAPNQSKDFGVGVVK